MNILTDKRPNIGLADDPLTPSAYYQMLCSSFERAGSGCETTELSYKICGFSVCLKFAGKALISYITPALSHLNSSHSQEADLTVLIWDSSSTGSIALKIPANLMEHSEQGLTLADDDCRIVYQIGEHTVNAFDKKRKRALFWVNDVSQLPFWIKGAPLRIILYLWLQTKGIQLIHGASVGKNGNGVVIAGKGGSGKSTLAVASLLSGFDYLGDDYIAISMDPVPSVHTLYCSAKLNRDNIKRFSGIFEDAFRNCESSADKGLVFLDEKYRLQEKLRLPLKAILIPRITNREDSNITAASPMSAMMALAPSTICQMPFVKQEVLTYFKGLVASIPSFNIELGTDIVGATRLLESFILSI